MKISKPLTSANVLEPSVDPDFTDREDRNGQSRQELVPLIRPAVIACGSLALKTVPLFALETGFFRRRELLLSCGGVTLKRSPASCVRTKEIEQLWHNPSLPQKPAVQEREKNPLSKRVFADSSVEGLEMMRAPWALLRRGFH